MLKLKGYLRQVAEHAITDWAARNGVAHWRTARPLDKVAEKAVEYGDVATRVAGVTKVVRTRHGGRVWEVDVAIARVVFKVSEGRNGLSVRVRVVPVIRYRLMAPPSLVPFAMTIALEGKDGVEDLTPLDNWVLELLPNTE